MKRMIWLLGLLLLFSGCNTAPEETVEETIDTSSFYLINHKNEQENWLYQTDKTVLNKVDAEELILASGLLPDKKYMIAFKECIRVPVFNENTGQKEIIPTSPVKQYVFEVRYKNVPIWDSSLTVTTYYDGATITGIIPEGDYPEDVVFLSKDKLISDFLKEYKISAEDCQYLGMYYFNQYFCYVLQIYPDSQTENAIIMINAVTGNVEEWSSSCIS